MRLVLLTTRFGSALEKSATFLTFSNSSRVSDADLVSVCSPDLAHRPGTFFCAGCILSSIGSVSARRTRASLVLDRDLHAAGRDADPVVASAPDRPGAAGRAA